MTNATYSGQKDELSNSQGLAESWRATIRSLRERFKLSTGRDTQLSPTFEFGQWRIAAEHQRGYRSVVIRWLGNL